MPTYEDLTGQRFGKLIALEKTTRRSKGGAWITVWKCKCDCGNMTTVDKQKLTGGTTISCGCERDNKIKNLNFKDLTGEKFNRLTVIRYLEPSERKTRGYNWLCRCDCGNYIHANASKLKTRHTKSCGCVLKEYTRSMNLKYKHRDNRMYGILRAAYSRCCNPKNPRYKDYGGRRITICSEWIDPEHGFDNFYEWSMKNGYNKNLTIDRIDVNGNYEPNNCRWISNLEQQSNRRNNKKFEYNGENKTITEWSRELDITYGALRWNLVNKNMTLQEYLSKK